MSRRFYIITAFVLAIIFTFLGWSQTFAYKVYPPAPTAIWFPSVVIANTYGGFGMIALSLIQFPLFAAGFAFGVRRWSASVVLAALLFIYALLVSVAFIIASR